MMVVGSMHHSNVVHIGRHVKTTTEGHKLYAPACSGMRRANVVENNILCQNLVGYDGYGSVIRGNRVHGNREGGIQLKGTGHTLEGNTVTHNAGGQADLQIYDGDGGGWSGTASGNRCPGSAFGCTGRSGEASSPECPRGPATAGPVAAPPPAPPLPAPYNLRVIAVP